LAISLLPIEESLAFTSQPKALAPTNLSALSDTRTVK